eukprot:scaffold348_cov329-Pavlova_lutheri.AAC.25
MQLPAAFRPSPAWTSNDRTRIRSPWIEHGKQQAEALNASPSQIKARGLSDTWSRGVLRGARATLVRPSFVLCTPDPPTRRLSWFWTVQNQLLTS